MKSQSLTEMNRPEWLAWRQEGIGSSDAPAIMRASPWTSPFELWARKTNRIAPQPTNSAMRRGLALEPVAREAYEELTGIEMPAARMEHPKRPFIRASFDGLNEKHGRVLEIKCPGRVDHLEARRGRIPKKYLWQCVHLLLVSGLPALDYFSWDGSTGVTVSMKRQRALETRLMAAEIEFWQYVQLDEPPPVTEHAVIPGSGGLFKIRRSR